MAVYKITFWITTVGAGSFVIETSTRITAEHIRYAREMGIECISSERSIMLGLDEKLDRAEVLAKYMIQAFGTGRWIIGGRGSIVEEVGRYARQLDDEHTVLII